MISLLEAWERVTAKRQEHQTAAGLKATVQETQDDHFRAGLEWIEIVCRSYGIELEDFAATLETALAESVPNLNALVAVGVLRHGDVGTAAFSAGFLSGLAAALERDRTR